MPDLRTFVFEALDSARDGGYGNIFDWSDDKIALDLMECDSDVSVMTSHMRAEAAIAAVAEHVAAYRKERV